MFGNIFSRSGRRFISEGIKRTKFSQRTMSTNTVYYRPKMNYIPLTFTFIGAVGAYSYFANKTFIAEDIPKETIEAVDWTGSRTLSSPEAIFRKYASVKGKTGEYFMTTSDFLRVITPFEPESGQDFSVAEAELTKLLQSVDLDSDGFISFPEFIFFTTLLSIPPKYTEIAFRMFDRDHGGSIDIDEFKDMMRLIRTSNPIAKGNGEETTEAPELDSFPVFFGKDGKKELFFNEFNSFIKELRDEVATVQFKMISSNGDTISARNYALSLISYGNIKKRSNCLLRIKELEESPVRITCEQYKAFLAVLESLDEIDFVLKLFVSAGEPFSPAQLKRAARAVTSVELSDELLDVVFFVFDTNGDGKLDYEEFVGTLQGHQQFGFSKPKDNSFIRFGKCMRYCWGEEISDRSAKATP